MTTALLLIQVVAERTWHVRRTIGAIAVEVFTCLLFVALFATIIVLYGRW